MNTKKLKTQSQLVVDKVVEYGGKISNQKHFAAIRDGFGAFLPFTIVGSLALMISSVLLDPNGLLAFLVYGDAYAPESGAWATMYFYIAPIFNGINTATIGFFALFISFMLGYYLMGSYKGNQLFGGSVGVVGFLLLAPMSADPDNALTYFGATGIIFAMFAGLLAPTIFHYIDKKWDLAIKMPDGVPPAITNGFALLIPITLTLFFFGLIQPVWGAIMYLAGPGKTVVDQLYYNLTMDVTYTIEGSGASGASTIVVQAIDGSSLYEIVSYGITNEFDVNETITAFDSIHGDGYVEGVLTSEIVAMNSTWENIALVENETGAIEFSNILTQTIESINGEWYYFINGMNAIIVSPLQNGSQNVMFVWVYLMMMTTLFFFGIHGPNTLSPISSLYTAAALQNVATFAALGSAAYDNNSLWAFTDQIQTYYGTMGGTGATLALMFVVAMFSKVPKTKEINKLAFGPGLFNINEPIIFGFPLMLNITYAIPFIFIMPIEGAVSTALIQAGFLKPQIYLVPWTTPAPIGAFLVTMDWKAPFWAIFLVIVAFFGYLPFVLLDAKAQAREELELNGHKRNAELKARKETIVDQILNSKEDKESTVSKQLSDELKNINLELKLIIKRQISESELMIQNHEGDKYFAKGMELIANYYDMLFKVGNTKDKLDELKNSKKLMSKSIKKFNKYQKPLNLIKDKETRFETQKLELDNIVQQRVSELEFKLSSSIKEERIKKLEKNIEKIKKTSTDSIQNSKEKLDKFIKKNNKKSKSIDEKINSK